MRQIDRNHLDSQEGNAGEKSARKHKHKSGTKPDTSLHLGNERRAWLQKQGGIQPTIIRLIDDAMKYE